MLLELGVMTVCGVVLYSLSQGAPYVPAKTKGIQQALDLLQAPKGSTIVDIGCGDGRVLIAAAERGYVAVGIEIQPVLWLIAWLRTRRFGGRVQVVYGNLWRWQLPEATHGVFVFSADMFAARLSAWLQAQQRRLGRPVALVTFGAGLPDRHGVQATEGCTYYLFDDKPKV